MFYSTRPEGTGLGLFLARSAIERSGGTVEAVDAGTGACIRIVLPMQATGKESAT
jgi:signal transduction histidine kinase